MNVVVTVDDKSYTLSLDFVSQNARMLAIQVIPLLSLNVDTYCLIPSLISRTCLRLDRPRNKDEILDHLMGICCLVGDGRVLSNLREMIVIVDSYGSHSSVNSILEEIRCTLNKKDRVVEVEYTLSCGNRRTMRKLCRSPCTHWELHQDVAKSMQDLTGVPHLYFLLLPMRTYHYSTGYLNVDPGVEVDVSENLYLCWEQKSNIIEWVSKIVDILDSSNSVYQDMLTCKVLLQSLNVEDGNELLLIVENINSLKGEASA